MLKFLSILLLVDFPIGADVSNVPSQFSSSSLSDGFPTSTHIRITSPSSESYSPSESYGPGSYSQPQSQFPPQSVQYASSPSSSFVGGSVYSDGSGVHVHPSSYPYDPATDYSDYAYDGYYGDSVHGNYLDPYNSYPPVDYGNPTWPATTFVNPSGIAPQNMVPGVPYLPSSPPSETRSYPSPFSGLGRVMPLNPDPYGQTFQETRLPQINGLGRVMHPQQSNDRTNQELLMFTLGRALGQLNNKTTTDAFLNYLLGGQQASFGPFAESYDPWGRSGGMWGQSGGGLWGEWGQSGGLWGQPNYMQDDYGLWGQQPNYMQDDYGLWGGQPNYMQNDYNLWGPQPNQAWLPNNPWGQRQQPANIPWWADLLGVNEKKQEQVQAPWWYDLLKKDSP